MTALRRSEKCGSIDGLSIARTEGPGLPVALNLIDGAA